MNLPVFLVGLLITLASVATIIWAVPLARAADKTPPAWMGNFRGPLSSPGPTSPWLIRIPFAFLVPFGVVLTIGGAIGESLR